MKRLFPLLLLLLLPVLLRLPAKAVSHVQAVDPALVVENGIATCDVLITAPNAKDPIEAIITLHAGSEVAETWTVEGVGCVHFTRSVPVSEPICYLRVTAVIDDQVTEVLTSIRDMLLDAPPASTCPKCGHSGFLATDIGYNPYPYSMEAPESCPFLPGDHYHRYYREIYHYVCHNCGQFNLYVNNRFLEYCGITYYRWFLRRMPIWEPFYVSYGLISSESFRQLPMVVESAP